MSGSWEACGYVLFRKLGNLWKSILPAPFLWSPFSKNNSIAKHKRHTGLKDVARA